MRYYENLFIVHPNYEMERLQKVINSVKEKIEELGGKIYVVDDWGKRKLAYQVQRQRFGNYVLIKFACNGNRIKELKEWMRVNQAIMMHLIVKLDKEPEVEEKGKKSLVEESENSHEG